MEGTRAMRIEGMAAIVTGGGSGLGEATALALAEAGARVAVCDRDPAAAERVAAAVGGLALPFDVTDAAAAEEGVARAAGRHGAARILVNCAGVAPARKILDREGRPMPLSDFAQAVSVNLLGTVNLLRLIFAGAAPLEPLATGERAVIVNTASIAAWDGQIGQTAYAASKAAIAGLTLPAAREGAALGIRVVAIAPGLFATPLLRGLPESAQEALGRSVPFPPRLGEPREFAAVVRMVVETPMLNGETIRLDGALRMPPR